MSEMFRLWIDGGTTNTRFTLTQGDQVVERTRRQVGATNADATFHNTSLADAVADEIEGLERKYGVRIARICAAGMITSQNGLMEIAHLTAPAGLRELANGIQTIHMPEISKNAPIDFIPGIRCGHGASSDVMRGEETEIMGCPGEGDRLFLHFGSHNKAILVRAGRIEQSLTTLSGELLYAAARDTILRSAVGELPSAVLHTEAARRGFSAAAAEGITRALFEARLYAMHDGATREEVYSFLVGALVQQDMTAFAPLLNQKVDETILYGQDNFAQAFLCNFHVENARTISHEESEWLSFQGMRKILQARDSGFFRIHQA